MSRGKILRVIDVPALVSKPVAVYSEHGLLLVTWNTAKCAYSITHAPSGSCFGAFDTLTAARKCANALKGAIEWEKLDASQPIPKALGEIVLPVVERWGRR